MEEKIVSILENLITGVDIRNCKTLADSGYIDSILVVNIITELAIEFDVEVTFDELVNENFNSVESICALVKRLQTEG